jgi:His-Xaa-Ser system radical SAM maturase HxsC
VLKLNVPGNSAIRPLTIDRDAILLVTENIEFPIALRKKSALLVRANESFISGGFAMVLVRDGVDHARLPNQNVLGLSADLNYLAEGDVVRVSKNSRLKTLYRRGARGVSLLVTERCNSFCVMCSQPPRDVADDYLIDEYLEAIPMFDRSTVEVIITGGEPTLLGDRLFSLLKALKSFLPETAVHVLSNGRTASDIELARKFAAVCHPDLMVGVPLYSDIAALHDFVVQADGAYDETLRGILNLKRLGVRVEIRVVIHRQTYKRLPELARFIARNLQFADHVALMGLELMGFARSNIDELWIDPVEYQTQLKEATHNLVDARIHTSIYNHQLCILDSDIRRYAVKSISDWKNEYMPECAGCSMTHECGGFFSSAHIKRSAHISPIVE